jgi:hypothetical protein
MTIGTTNVPMLKSPYNPFKKELREKFINARKRKENRKKAVYDKLTSKLGIENLKVHIRVVH